MKKRFRETYAIKKSDADIQAMEYMEAMSRTREIRAKLQEAIKEEEIAEERLKYILSNGKEKTAIAYLIEFKLNEKGYLTERIMKKSEWEDIL